MVSQRENCNHDGERGKGITLEKFSLSTRRDSLKVTIVQRFARGALREANLKSAEKDTLDHSIEISRAEELRVCRSYVRDSLLLDALNECSSSTETAEEAV